ncbi:MAG: thioredoxin family protein [Desulfatitalea sp.]|nr:thioredoxin family protein [Desulfatitalea sp.]
MMKHVIPLLILLCGLTAPMVTRSMAEPASAVAWQDYEAAQKSAQGQSRKFLLYFYTDWCGYCRKLEKETFSDKTVADYLNNNFIPVRINSEKMPKLAGRFGVSGVPDLRFVSPKGEDIARWPGYIEASKLLPMLKYIHTESYQTMSYGDFLKAK